MSDATPLEISRIRLDDCWVLLRRTATGVLATATDGHPDLFPVNFLVDGRTLMIRSAPGAKVQSLEANPHAAFLAQGHDAEGNWSVVMRGSVEVTSDQVEVVGSGALELESWAPGSKRVFIRLTPESVQGRRVPRGDLDRAGQYS